jgi:hypothetical protein
MRHLLFNRNKTLAVVFFEHCSIQLEYVAMTYDIMPPFSVNTQLIFGSIYKYK